MSSTHLRCLRFLLFQIPLRFLLFVRERMHGEIEQKITKKTKGERNTDLPLMNANERQSSIADSFLLPWESDSRQFVFIRGRILVSFCSFRMITFSPHCRFHQ